MTGPADDADLALPAVIVPVGAPVATAPDGLAGYRKLIGTAAGTFVLGVLAALAFGAPGISAEEWYQVAVTTAAAAGFTYSLPNAQLFKATK